VAGDKIGAVLDNEIYRRTKPSELTSASLTRILDVGDRLAISRLASISRGARDTLFDLDTAELRTLSRNVTESELETLAGYLGGLAKAPRDRVLKALATEPATMKLIASEPLRRAVVTSRDQSAAVEIMLRPQGLVDPVAAYEDIRLAWEGRVQPMLIWEKHPAAIVALGIVGLLFVLFLWRLLVPRRRRTDTAPPVATEQKPATGNN